ncbi:hypothetical protein EJ08DRAFT_690715 [Tothia fuscella]|uniref:PH domain-containing protein n=1 Tax=Tothia fuscella TaxID=1048955 RepID=A0A9P4NEU4_9PEZI|nr:hypothetical protein EJ08DRAFT_690715 [Tothia fuscella]
MAAPSQHSSLPTRSNTTATRSSTLSDDELPGGEDTSEVTKLFHERLQAWKHACGYLEEYLKATEKLQHAHGKEYEKVLKTVSHPLKEAHHFDQQLGGVAGLFESIRSNTTGISNSHYETAKVLKGTVLPMFERLHAEIKAKTKELTKGAGKQSKAVDKARNLTQKHVESFSQQTASFDSTGGKIHAADDPYILQRGIRHRMNKQIIEENNNRQDLIQVQNSFAQFEAHVLQTLQHGLGQFHQIIGQQADQTKVMYGDMVSTGQRIPPDFEWQGFVKRNGNVLIDPAAPPRSMSNISFPNQDHKATQPILAGSLSKKSKLLRKFETAYYVVTPSKFLHQFGTDDDIAKDPVPELSLYLPDCVVGGIDGQLFNVKGKDVSKGKLGVNVSMSHEYQLKANTVPDAQIWWEVLRDCAGQVTNEVPAADSVPNSPAVGHQAGSSDSATAAAAGHPAPLQTQGITNEEKVMSPVENTPHSATTHAAPSGIPPAQTSGVDGKVGDYRP